MAELHCAPKTFENSINDHTCYSKSDLITIVESYNKATPVDKIKIAPTTPKKELHKKIKNKLENKCGDDEACWIEQNFIDYDKKKKLEDLFRPKKPKEWYKNNRTWLNTYDILYVLQQYEDKYNDFIFLGVYPIDFGDSNSFGNCIGDVMCTFNIKQMKQKKKDRFGMVLNLDRHDEPGSHWVAVFCNINPDKENFGIYYYDSVAYPPSNEVKQFMFKIYNQISSIYSKDISDRFQYGENKIQKQFKNTECGIFSIVFITQCLKNVSFPHICVRMKKDDDINKIRDILYRPSIFKPLDP